MFVNIDNVRSKNPKSLLNDNLFASPDINFFIFFSLQPLSFFLYLVVHWMLNVSFPANAIDLNVKNNDNETLTFFQNTLDQIHTLKKL